MSFTKEIRINGTPTKIRFTEEVQYGQLMLLQSKYPENLESTNPENLSGDQARQLITYGLYLIRATTNLSDQTIEQLSMEDIDKLLPLCKKSIMNSIEKITGESESDKEDPFAELDLSSNGSVSLEDMR